MTLADLRPGDTAEVITVMKGRRAQMRLLEIGISPGTRVTVVAAHPWKGPIVVRVGSLEAALGWGLASSVKVKLLPKGSSGSGKETDG